jgi:hypothetical protein
MFLKIMHIMDKPSWKDYQHCWYNLKDSQTLLSPPSYTVLVDIADSVLRPAFLNMKCWNLEYEGGLFIDIIGRFHEISIGGGPRLLIRFRRASVTGSRPCAISWGE